MRVASGMSGGAPIGLDMNAALALGAARGCDMELLAGVLPAAESVLLSRHSEEDEGVMGDVEGGEA